MCRGAKARRCTRDTTGILTRRRGGASHAASAQLIQLSVLTKITLAVYTTVTNRDLPVRIDQEVEMTDRLQEVGFIYYRGLRTDHTVM